MRLLGNMAAMADQYGSEWLVACPRLEYVPMYERLFGFRKLAGAATVLRGELSDSVTGYAAEGFAGVVQGCKSMRESWELALKEMA